jgi:hypothetical protein
MKKGQSILEYVIMLTVIIAGVVLASDYLKDKVQKGTENAADSIENSLSGNPSLGNPTDPGNPDNPVNPVNPNNPNGPNNPPGPTTPVPIGTLPNLDLSYPEADKLKSDITIYLPPGVSYPPFQLNDILRRNNIKIGGTTGSSSLQEQSETGYVTWTQRHVIEMLFPSSILDPTIGWTEVVKGYPWDPY